MPNFSSPSHKASFYILIAFLTVYTFITPTSTRGEALHAASYSIEPFSFHNENGDLIGIIPEFINLISERVNLKINIRQYPYGRMLKALNDGSSDFTIHIRSSITEGIADSLVKVGDIKIYITGKKGIKIDDYNDLYKLTISKPRGAFFDDRFDNDKNMNIINVNGHENSTKLMVYDRVDAVVAPIESVYYELHKLGLDNFPLGKPYLLSKKELWLRFSKKSNQHKERENVILAVKSLVEEGAFKKIYEKYLPKPI